MLGREAALLVGCTGPSPSGLRPPFRQHAGHGVHRLVLIPQPAQDRTDDELKQLADDYLEPILAMLVKEG
jgi:hypothetical protein